MWRLPQNLHLHATTTKLHLPFIFLTHIMEFYTTTSFLITLFLYLGQASAASSHGLMTTVTNLVNRNNCTFRYVYPLEAATLMDLSEDFSLQKLYANNEDPSSIAESALLLSPSASTTLRESLIANESSTRTISSSFETSLFDTSTSELSVSETTSAAPSSSLLTSSATAASHTTSPSPSNSVVSKGFYLRSSATSSAATGTYGFLIYGGKTGGKRKRSDYYVVDFTSALTNASLFSLDSASHLRSGNYTAALPYAAKNATVQFLPSNNTAVGQGVAAHCTIAADDTLSCLDQETYQFYICGNSALKLGISAPAGCVDIALYFEPASTVSTSSTATSISIFSTLTSSANTTRPTTLPSLTGTSASTSLSEASNESSATTTSVTEDTSLAADPSSIASSSPPTPTA